MATIAELLEAANRKVQRGEETKALLKTRLTEKGLDVASENNFYNLANKVGEISGFTIDFYNKLASHGEYLEYTENLEGKNFVFFLMSVSGSEMGDSFYNYVIFGYFNSNENQSFYMRVLPISYDKFIATLDPLSSPIVVTDNKIYLSSSEHRFPTDDEIGTKGSFYISFF